MSPEEVRKRIAHYADQVERIYDFLDALIVADADRDVHDLRARLEALSRRAQRAYDRIQVVRGELDELAAGLLGMVDLIAEELDAPLADPSAPDLGREGGGPTPASEGGG